MRIWLTYRLYYPDIGGIETRVYQVSKALTELGHEVTVLSGSHPPVVPRKEYASVCYLKMPATKLMTLPIVRKQWFRGKLRALVRSTPAERLPERIIACDEQLANLLMHLLPSVPVVLALGFNMRKLRITTPLTIKSIKSLITTPVFQLMRLYVCKEQAKALNGCKKNVVLSESIRQGFIQYYHVPPNKITVCYPGVSLSCPEELLARKHPSPRKRLLYVGRISIEKNVVMLLQALAILNDPELHLTMVGGGPEADQLQALCQQYGLTRQVCMAGVSYSVAEYYAQADYLALPSRYESFGQVIIEGFTFGLPVIGYATIAGVSETAVEELTENGRNGFVADQLTPEALAASIRRAFALSDAEYADMSKRCAAFAAERCSWQRFARACIEETTQSISKECSV